MRHVNNNWIDETSSSSTGLLTLTAAWCWLRVWRGVLLLLIVLMLASQTNNKLSFPPLARNFPSGDHFNPHTSWECLANVATWWWATRTSWWCIAPLLHPLKQYWTKKIDNLTIVQGEVSCHLRIIPKMEWQQVHLWVNTGNENDGCLTWGERITERISGFQVGIGPTTSITLVGCSNHWAKRTPGWATRTLGKPGCLIWFSTLFS